MELKKIYVVLAAKYAEFDDAMASIGGKIAGAGKSLEEMGKSMSATGAAMTKGLTLPIVGAGAAILALVTKSASAADALETMSKQTGISVERLQEMRYVASQTNTSFDAITIAVATMTRNMVDSTEEGSKMEAAFGQIGVQVKNTDGTFRDMNDVFPETLKALAGMSPGVDRNNLLMQIFGTRAKELIPMLDAGTEGIEAFTARAHELGLVTPGTNKVLADFNDKMDEVKQVLGAAFTQLAAKFLPILREELIPLITDKVVPALMKFADWIGGLIDKFTSLSPQTQNFILAALGMLAALGPVLSIIGKVTSGVGGFMGSLENLNVTMLLIKVGIGLLMLAIAYLITHWDDVKAAGIRAWTGIKPYIQPVIDLVQWVIDKVEKAIDWFGRLFGMKKGTLATSVAEVTENVDGLTNALVGESLVPALDAWAAASDGAAQGMAEAGRESQKLANALLTSVTPAVEGATGAIQAYIDTAQQGADAATKLADDWAKTTKAIAGAGGIKEYAEQRAVEMQMASPGGKIVGGAKDFMDALKAAAPDYAAEVAAMATAAGMDIGVGETMMRTKLLKDYEAGLIGLAGGGWLTRPTLLTDLLSGRPYGIAAEHGPEAIVPAGGMGAPAASNVFNVTMQVRADDIRSLANLIDLFKHLPQVARAMGGVT